MVEFSDRPQAEVMPLQINPILLAEKAARYRAQIIDPGVLAEKAARYREQKATDNQRRRKSAEYVPAGELVRDFKKVAFETRANDVWGKIVKSLPRDTVNPIHALIKARAKESGISLSEEETVALTNRYKTLREKAGLNSFDRDLNHWALVNFFLRREGVIGKKPAKILSWRQRAPRWAAAGMAALTVGTTVGETLPKAAAGLMAPPILSAQTIPENEQQIPAAESTAQTAQSTILRPASAEELQRQGERMAFFKELEGLNQYVRIRNNITEKKQTPIQTISSATLATEKPTFFIPGTNTPANVEITNKDLQVLRPAGHGRFLVETDSGVFEIPFGDIQLKEILWNRGKPPLPWLGFDSEYPQLTEKIPQLGAGIVRLSLDQANEKDLRQKSHVLETIAKAKEKGLKIIIAYNPTRLLPDEEAAKRLDRILSLMGNYKNFALELGNEPDLPKFWEEKTQEEMKVQLQKEGWDEQQRNEMTRAWALESFAKFISQTSNILTRKGVKINLIIGSLLDEWEDKKMYESASELAKQLRNQRVDLSQFVFSLHVFGVPSRIKKQVDALKREFGDNVSFIVTEGGSNDPDDRGLRTVQIIKEARKYGAREVIVFQLRDKEYELKNENEPEHFGYINLDEKTGQASWITAQIGPLLEYVMEEMNPRHDLSSTYTKSAKENIRILPDGRRVIVPSNAYKDHAFTRDSFYAVMGLKDIGLSISSFDFFTKAQKDDGQIPTATYLDGKTEAEDFRDDESTLLYLAWAGIIHQEKIPINQKVIERAFDFIQKHAQDGWYVSPQGDFSYWADTYINKDSDVITYNQGLYALALRSLQKIRPDLVPQQMVDQAETNYRALFRSDLGFLPLSSSTQFQDASALLPEFLARYYFGKGILSDEQILMSVDHLIETAAVSDKNGVVGIKTMANADGSFLPTDLFSIPALNGEGNYQNGGYWPMQVINALSLAYKISGDNKYRSLIEALIKRELEGGSGSKEFISLEPNRLGHFDENRLNYSWNALIPTALRWAGII